MGAPTDDPELISVHEFAHRYRVDVSVVRSWVKSGHIPYKLVGYRKMIRTGDIPKIVKPIEPIGPVRARLIDLFVEKMEMDRDTARSIVETMSLDDVYTQTIQLEAEHEQPTQEQGRDDHPPRPASTGKGAANSRRDRVPPRRSR